MDTLTSLRKEINEIDEQIMDLLDKRMTVSTKIGILKQDQNHPVLDTNRELLIYNKTSKYSHSPQIRSIYNTIMSESKSLQRK